MRKIYSSLFLLAFMATFSVLGQTNYYVATTGNDANDGLSLGNAKATIQDVLDDYDLEPGDIINIGAGTFNENNINSNAGNDDNGFKFQGAGIDVTIIDGGGTDAVFDFGGGTGCTGGQCRDIEFHDMTIQNGSGKGAAINMYWNPGADLYDVKVDNCDPGANSEAAVHLDDNTASTSNTDHILSNVTIQNCNSTNGSGALWVQMYPDGVGITGTLNMTNCTISNNSGDDGTVYLETNYSGMHVYMDSCTFANNSATNGGAIYTDEAASGSGFDSLLISRCTFYGNTASQGSAVYADGEGDEYYENCLFYENEASGNKGGVIHLPHNNGPKVVLRNCTVTDNTHSGSNIGGIVHVYDFGGQILIRNSIIYNNENKDIHFNSWLGTMTLDNCVYGSTTELDAAITKNSSTTSAPGFVDASNDDYDITNTGAAYDAGSATWAPAEDIEGTSRPQNGADDIGAYEYGGAVCTTPSTLATSATVTSIDSMAATIGWTRGDGDKVLVVVKEGGAVTDPTANTTYTASADWSSKGDDVGSSSYAVYTGTGTSVTLSNLDYVTTYHVGIYEYNETNGPCYTAVLSTSFTTDSCRIYVDDASNTGDTWTPAGTGDDATGNGSVTAPYASLEKVFADHQITSKCVIYVDKGTYNSTKENNIEPDANDQNIVIIGADTADVIIDPPGTDPAFTFDNNGNVTLKNIKINGGASTSIGGGLYFYENTTSSTLTLTTCVISNNVTTGTNGGGVYVYATGLSGVGNFVATDCHFYGNTAANQAGGIQLFGNTDATYTMSKCIFNGNSSNGDGSAIYVYNGDLNMTNCLVYENTMNTGDGAIYLRDDSASFMNVTIADNTGGTDCGIYARFSNDTELQNCIVYGNDGEDLNRMSGTFTVNNSCYESATGTMTINSSTTSDPQFADSANDNYDIVAGSPAEDSGDNTGAPTDDLNDVAREGTFDMGCYERGSFSSLCSYPSTQVSSLDSTAMDSTSVALSWTRGDGDKVIIVVKEGSSPNDPADGTTYPSASSDWDSKGTDVGGSSSYVVYDGTGTSVTLTNLNYGTQYYIVAYEYTDATKCYKVAGDAFNFSTDNLYLYVNDNSTTGDVWSGAVGSDANNGSAATPYLTIQKAFDDHRLESGAIIRVDNGTYTTSSALNPDDDDDDFTILGASTTGVIITNNNTQRVFSFVNNGDVTLNSLTVQNGSPSSGEGGNIYFSESEEVTFTLLSCVIQGGGTTLSEGGGLAIEETGANNSNLIMRNCTLTNNAPGSHGGGLYLNGGAAATYEITRCVFENNTVGSNYSGSAIYETEGLMKITNCLFFENENGTSFANGCVRANTGNDTLINCTFADNTGSDAGLFNDVGTTVAINCLFYNNSGDDIHVDGTVVTTNCYYNSVQGSTTSTDDVTGNVDMFANRAGDDYDITDGCAAEDAGTNTNAPADDLTGTTRLSGGNTITDIGCYEQGSNNAQCSGTITWDGSAGDGLWSTAANWDLNLVPCGNPVVIPDLASDPTLDTRGDCGSLTINGAAVLTWSSADTLYVSDNLDLNSTVNINHTGSGVFYLYGTTKTINVDASVTTTNVPVTIAGSYTMNTDWAVESVSIKSGGSLSIDSGEKIDVGGTVSNEGTLTLAGTAQMDIEGDLTNNGTFNENTSLVTFDGSSAQDISGSGTTNFSDITLDNAAGLTLNRAVTVSDDLTLTDGVLTTTVANLLTMDNGSDDNAVDIIGGNSGDYISGPVRIVGYQSAVANQDTLRIPTGDGAHYGPIWIIPSSTNATTWEVRYADSSAVTLSGASKCANDFKKVSDEDLYRVRRVSGTSDAKLRFYWNSNSQLNAAKSVIGDLIIAHRNDAGNCWGALNTDSNMYKRNFNQQYIQTMFDVSDYGYSQFSLASYEGLIDLPVELISFEATISDDRDRVALNWEVATELNNDYYEVHKRVGKKDYEFVGMVHSNGDTYYGESYQLIDLTPSLGITDYKLVQYELSGDSEDLAVSTVINRYEEFEIIFAENELLVSSGMVDMELDLTVTNVLGELILHKMISSNQLETVQTNAPGVYFLRIDTGVESYQKKVIIH